VEAVKEGLRVSFEGENAPAKPQLYESSLFRGPTPTQKSAPTPRRNQ